MQTQKREKEPITIDVKPQELRNIMEQFKPDMLRDTEEFYGYKDAMGHLDKSDQIIFSLYAELESERKVAELLGVSRSPIHKIIVKIRKQILEYDNTKPDTDTSDDSVCS